MDFKQFQLAVLPAIDNYIKATRNRRAFKFRCSTAMWRVACDKLGVYFDDIAPASAFTLTYEGFVNPVCKFGEMPCQIKIGFNNTADECAIAVFYANDHSHTDESKYLLYAFAITTTGCVLWQETHFGNLVRR